MNTLTVDRAQADPAAYRGRPASTAGLSELPEDTVVRSAAGQPLVAYLRVWSPGDAQLERLRAGLLGLEFTRHRRVSGLSVNAMSFGSLPRITIRNDWCKSAVVNRDHPGLVAELTAVAAELEARYADLAPTVYAGHAQRAGQVEPAWLLPGSRCFTGGTLNRDNAIGYHHDRGNFKATFSAMPVVRAGMTGGELVVPELGVYLPAADGTVVFFDGQDLLHAVTPMAKASRDAHRFSVVYYSLSQLWNCLPPAAEVERIQAKRTERELHRATGAGPRNVAASALAKAAALTAEREGVQR